MCKMRAPSIFAFWLSSQGGNSPLVISASQAAELSSGCPLARWFWCQSLQVPELPPALHECWMLITPPKQGQQTHSPNSFFFLHHFELEIEENNFFLPARLAFNHSFSFLILEVFLCRGLVLEQTPRARRPLEYQSLQHLEPSSH